MVFASSTFVQATHCAERCASVTSNFYVVRAVHVLVLQAVSTPRFIPHTCDDGWTTGRSSPEGRSFSGTMQPSSSSLAAGTARARRAALEEAEPGAGSAVPGAA